MGQTQDKSRKPIDDWGTTTQKITYEKCIRKIDEYETPINLPNYGREILNLAYNHNLKMEKKNPVNLGVHQKPQPQTNWPQIQ